MFKKEKCSKKRNVQKEKKFKTKEMTMQRINITRTYRKNSYTIGKLYVNGSFVCHTLELHDSTYYGEDFVLGKSAIPVGVYTLATSVWSPKFQDFRPRITDFKYSKNILIHEGNKPEDTEGCILVGKNSLTGMVLNSRATLEKLQKKLSEHDSWKLIVS